MGGGTASEGINRGRACHCFEAPILLEDSLHGPTFGTPVGRFDGERSVYETRDSLAQLGSAGRRGCRLATIGQESRR